MPSFSIDDEFDLAMPDSEGENIPDDQKQAEAGPSSGPQSKTTETYSSFFDAIRTWNVDMIIKTKEKLRIPDSFLKSPEVVKAFSDVIVKCFNKGDTWTPRKIVENFWLPKEIKIELGCAGIAKILDDKDVYYLSIKRESMPKIQEIQKKFSVPKSRVDDIVFEIILQEMETDHSYKMKELREIFSIPKEKFKAASVIEKLYAMMMRKLNGDYPSGVQDMLNEFGFLREKMELPETVDAGYQRLLRAFAEGDLWDVGNLKNYFPSFEEKMKSPEVGEHAYQGLIHMMKNPKDSSSNEKLSGYLEGIIKLDVIPVEKLKSPEARDLAAKHLREYAQKGWFGTVEDLTKLFPDFEAKLSSPEYIGYAYKAILDELERHDDRDALKIKQASKIPEENMKTPEILAAAAEGIRYWLDAESEHMERAIGMRDNFPVPEEMLAQIAGSEFTKKIRTGDIEGAVLIGENFPIPEEVSQSEEVVEIVTAKISEYFSKENFEAAFDLAKNLKISQEFLDPLLHELLAQLVARGKFFDVKPQPEEEPEPDPVDEADPDNNNEENNDNEEHDFEQAHHEDDDDPENFHDDFPGAYDDEDGYEYGSRGSGGSTLTVESLLARFPHLKEFLDSKEMNAQAQNFFLKFASMSGIEAMKNIMNKFPISPETIKIAFKNVWDTLPQDFAVLSFLNDLPEKPIDPLVSRTSTIFGEFGGSAHYAMLHSILKGTISEDMKRFGVRQGGDAGILQLEQGFVKFRGDMLREDFDPHILQQSPLARDYFKAQVRFSESEWKGREDNFEAIVGRYIELYDQGEYEMFPMNEHFVPSEIMYIDTVNRKTETISYTKSFLERFATIENDIKEAKRLYMERGSGPFSGIVENIHGKLEPIAEGLRSIMNDPNPKNGKGEPLGAKQIEMRNKNLQEKIDALESINLRSLKDFQKNFTLLSEYKTLESDLRQAMFVMGFAKNHAQMEKDLEKVNIENPSLDDITWMMNFVDHIVNKEVMTQFFTDKSALKKFRDLISVKSFEDELSRFQNQEKIGTMPVQFVPTRGLLMEFSGHIADACWANKYKYTIPATFPNMSAVIMVQNPGTKHERLCGSCILIETREGKRDGKPILLVRGLNPIENVINNLSIKDFYEKFTSYVNELAAKTGRKPAIVIDGNSGGSGTNRPLLFNHLSSLKKDLAPVRVPYRETEFNGYDVTKNCYLIKKEESPGS